ncbi:uncharacterized protein si:ch211-12e13.12 [Osmerus mordax]|uniref:uncharacterized protein si:ch211-12e13.12 n=1 Tax=Osmerus mordax TaxID=8014 RepID=UPI00350EDA3F
MVSEDNHRNAQAVQRATDKYMKKHRKGESTLHLSSPTGGSRVRVYDDCQRVAYEVFPGGAHPTENGARSKGPDALGQVGSPNGGGKAPCPSDGVPNGGGQRDIRDQRFLKDSLSTLTCDTTSQTCSGAEDNSTEAHETLTETSTLTFVDAHTADESGEMRCILGVGVHVKEFVLIDDDDDGDMSLREKTVTDMSIMDGNAADLVCGRLLSISSGSLSESKEENPPPQTSPVTETETPGKQQRCCFCAIL